MNTPFPPSRIARAEISCEAASGQVPEAGTSFRREEHQALHALTLGPLVRDTWCFRTIADIPVRIEAVDALRKLGLVRLRLLDLEDECLTIPVAELSARGRIVAEQLGPPGVFPLPGMRSKQEN